MGTRDRRGRIRLWSGSGQPRDPDQPVARVPVPEVAVLRNTGAALRKFGLTMAGLVVGPTIGVAIGIQDPDDALAFGLGLLVAVGPYTLRRFLRKYTIRGNILEVRTLFRRFDVDLPNADSVALRVINKDEENCWLELVLNEDLRIILGQRDSPSYFEPDALFALAFALQRSEYTGHREVGQQIQRLAERPTRDSWPE